MGLSIILTTTLLTTLNPDLCADVYTDANGTPYTDAVGQTWSRFCDWTGPSAPLLNRDVCCTMLGNAAACTLPNTNGRCKTGSKMYCEHGEVLSTGAVVCQQPFPSICEFGFCGDVLPPDSGPLEDGICCFPNGVCINVITFADLQACADGGGVAGYCEYGVTNDDGSVDCFD
jgi:hypothetical protein